MQNQHQQATANAMAENSGTPGRLATTTASGAMIAGTTPQNNKTTMTNRPPLSTGRSNDTNNALCLSRTLNNTAKSTLHQNHLSAC